MWQILLNDAVEFLRLEYSCEILAFIAFVFGFLCGQWCANNSEANKKSRTLYEVCERKDKFTNHTARILLKRNRKGVESFFCVALDKRGICRVTQKPCKFSYLT